MPYIAFRSDLFSALGCEIVLDRDQDHNDLDKCLLTVKDRKRDKVVDEAIGDLDAMVSSKQLVVEPNI